MAHTTNSSNRPAPSGVKRIGAVTLAVCALLPAVAATGSRAGAANLDAPVRLTLSDISQPRLGRGGAADALSATVTNYSLVTATQVRVRMVLPDSIDFAAQTSSDGCSERDRLVTCIIPSLGAGAQTAVRIGVINNDSKTPLGIKDGYFLPVDSAEFNPGAGEIRFRSWNAEADGQGADPTVCWPITNPSPNMDIGGGGTGNNELCDGTNDSPELAPDSEEMLSEFSAPYSAQVTRSWEWATDITAPSSGDFKVCFQGIDDGGYVAVQPVGEPLTADSVVVSRQAYSGGTLSSPLFTLTSGTQYHVVIRIANRGGQGLNNGGAGLGGWGFVGIAPENDACSSASAGAFGTAGWQQFTQATVEVAAGTDIAVTGAIISAPTNGVRTTTARIANNGPDVSPSFVTVSGPTGSRPGANSLCSVDPLPTRWNCPVGDLPVGGSATVTLTFPDQNTRPVWLGGSFGIDADPSNN